jgi:hypothetical protein
LAWATAGSGDQLLTIVSIGQANQVGENCGFVCIGRLFADTKQHRATEFRNGARQSQTFSDQMAGDKNDPAPLFLSQTHAMTSLAAARRRSRSCSSRAFLS